MKKWFSSVVLLFLMTLALAGCSSGKTAKGTWSKFVSTFNKAAEASPQDIESVAALFYTSGSSLYTSFVDTYQDTYFGDVTHLKTKSFSFLVENKHFACADIMVARTIDGFAEDSEFIVYMYVNLTTGKWIFCTPVNVTDELGCGNKPNKSYYNGIVETETIVDDEYGTYDVNYRHIYSDAANFVESADDTITYISPVKNQKVQVIPEEIGGYDVTTIADFAFYKVSKILNVTFSASKMTSVIIPSSITSIGEDSFYQCRKLKEVDIPSSVTSVGEYCFASCTGLKTMTIHVDDSKNYGSLAAATTTGSLKISGATNSYVGDVLTLKATYKNEDVTSRVKWEVDGGYSSFVSVGTYTGIATCLSATSDNATVRITGTLLNKDGSVSSTTGSVAFSIGTVPSTITFGNHSLDRLSGLKYLYIDAINPNSVNFYTGFALPKKVIIYVPPKDLTTWQTSTYLSAYAKQIQAWPEE